MALKTNKPKPKTESLGFTIVELLIVVIIIGILAAIAIISYVGISKRATEAGLVSDLSSAKRQLELYKTEYESYPTILDANKCPTAPTNDPKYCLKNKDFEYTTTDNGLTYSLKLTKSDITYATTNNTSPASVGATVITFAKTWGGASSEFANALTHTADGGYAIAGNTSSFGAGSGDAFLAKYDPSGNLLWNKTWGGTGSESAYGLIQTADGGYAIAGYTSSHGYAGYDVFLAKYDSLGSLVWNKTWGYSGIDMNQGGLIQTADGGYVISGRTTSYGAGSGDVFLAKFSSLGNLVWSKTWGGTGSEGNYGGLIQTADGGYAIAGDTSSFGAGSSDVFIAKYDSSGVLVWSKTWGGTGIEYVYDLIQTKDGDYAIAGSTTSFGAGNQDAFLAKFDSLGSLVWNKTWGGASSEVSHGLVQTADGGYAMSGEAYTNESSNDIFITKYDSSGVLVWNKTWGGTGSDKNEGGLAQTTDGGYAIVGTTSSYGAGDYDAFLLKTSSLGEIAGCDSVMCKSPIATTNSPTATVTSPSATITSPTAFVTTPSTTTTTPSAISTTIIPTP